MKMAGIKHVGFKYGACYQTLNISKYVHNAENCPKQMQLIDYSYVFSMLLKIT